MPEVHVTHNLVWHLSRLSNLAKTGDETGLEAADTLGGGLRDLVRIPAGLLYSIAPGWLCSTSATGLSRHSSDVDTLLHGRLNLLTTGAPSNDPTSKISTWQLALNLDQSATSMTRLAVLASDLSCDLCALHRYVSTSSKAKVSRAKIKKLFEELLGGSRGAELIRHADQALVRWEIAVHAREIARDVAPDWYRQTCKILQAVPDDQWHADRLFKNAPDFLSVLESNGSKCRTCPSVIKFNDLSPAHFGHRDGPRIEEIIESAEQSKKTRNAYIQPIIETLRPRVESDVRV
ncbi:hypothetical protein BKA62DRAFT_675023 [Auriculariales sp. MPI-PUGE-AT-0066]|nr:hypothetical protein BKA62DRAFT_675023 [Auriculariales sp. MPI-PUGE-AT-0066]